MWNYFIKRGALWTTKSLNVYESYYPGMSYGTSIILINNIFKDENGNTVFTYFKTSKLKQNHLFYKEVKIEKDTLYILLDNIYSGVVTSLDAFYADIKEEDLIDIIKSCEVYYNFKISKKKESTIVSVETEETKEETQQRLFKFGIDIYVTENEHVKITTNKKIILSPEAREDIIYNSKTEEDLLELCKKYKIFPVKAIKEIRNRLQWQHRQNKG